MFYLTSIFKRPSESSPLLDPTQTLAPQSPSLNTPVKPKPKKNLNQIVAILNLEGGHILPILHKQYGQMRTYRLIRNFLFSGENPQVELRNSAPNNFLEAYDTHYQELFKKTCSSAHYKKNLEALKTGDCFFMSHSVNKFSLISMIHRTSSTTYALYQFNNATGLQNHAMAFLDKTSQKVFQHAYVVQDLSHESLVNFIDKSWGIQFNSTFSDTPYKTIIEETYAELAQLGAPQLISSPWGPEVNPKASGSVHMSILNCMLTADSFKEFKRNILLKHVDDLFQISVNKQRSFELAALGLIDTIKILRHSRKIDSTTKADLKLKKKILKSLPNLRNFKSQHVFQHKMRDVEDPLSKLHNLCHHWSMGKYKKARKLLEDLYGSEITGDLDNKKAEQMVKDIQTLLEKNPDKKSYSILHMSAGLFLLFEKWGISTTSINKGEWYKRVREYAQTSALQIYPNAPWHDDMKKQAKKTYDTLTKNS